VIFADVYPREKQKNERYWRLEAPILSP